MTTNLHDLILQAAATVQQARALTAPPADPAAVQRVLACLPVAAQEAMAADPGAADVVLWQGASRVLAVAVVAALGTEGVDARTADGGRIFVSIPSLLAAAARVTASHTLATLRVEWCRAEGATARVEPVGDGYVLWDGAGEQHAAVCGVPIDAIIAAAQPTLTAFRAAWAARVGDGAAVRANPVTGTLIISAPGSAQEAILAPGWRSRPGAALAEEARLALALPRWTLPVLAAQWTERAGAGAAVRREESSYSALGIYRPIPFLAFAAAGGGEQRLDVVDVLDLTEAAVVAMVADMMGLMATAPPPRADGRRVLAWRASHATPQR